MRRSFTRRRALGAAAAVAGSGVAARLSQLSPPVASAAPPRRQHPLVPGSSHSGFAQGSTTVDPEVNGFDPSTILRDFDWGRTKRLAGGRMLREWELVAYDKQIEIVPGVKFSAWTFNGRVPGPTLRVLEGDLLRIHFVNAGSHPHTIHFHGIHPAAMDGTPGVARGDRRRPDRRRGEVHLRVRRTAVWPAPVPLPRVTACRAHREGPLRHVHRRSAAWSARRRRARDGAERVRSELQRRQ